MEAREIKFKIYRKSKLDGYEELREDGWWWRCIELDPDPDEKGVPRERWTPGVYPRSERPGYVRAQFTGLLDKSGKEIYEGDVIAWDYEYDSDYDGDMPIVKRTAGRAAVKDIFDRWRINEAAKEGNGVTVIGNIYANPELAY